VGYSVPVTYVAELSGPAEDPPNASPGTGTAIVTIDVDAHTMRVQVTFSGLLFPTTASHIHAATATANAGTAGVATQTPSFAGFPLGVTSGTMDTTFDLTAALSFNPAYVTANGGTLASAEAALAAALAAEKAYLNIHTTELPRGEIRGFLSAVPDATATAPLLGLVLVALVGFARRKRIGLA
jgi:hypothetical protein